ncbi:MAG: filamentous hemagglutinin N-terminal domain-containing protein [Coleofasciculus sp. G1-WW12-02]|uniref:two-partner secretion domain-containing protein n=1 Tax=Coleofasciculus sp. G1-WW12-02 TaxID=3068483 RepID=UPI0032FE024F
MVKITHQSAVAGWKMVGAINALAGVGLALAPSDQVFAQIVPDGTIGAEGSLVTPDVNINGGLADRIDGGATRGANLFHSFEQFNIGDGQRVYFANPTSIENIFSRVTGTDPSDILGTLGVNGGANLFLLNPNGIIFGENATLDIRGSFVSTTANAIQFGNQGVFSATDPESPALLTINPSALFFNQMMPGQIENRSRVELSKKPERRFGLQVPEGRSLLLIGGDIVIEGGGLNAEDGRVELAGVAAPGIVGLTVDGNTLSLNMPDSITPAQVTLTNKAKVNVSGEGGGFIGVWGDRVLLTDSSELSADTLGRQNGQGLVIQASQLVIRDGSQVSATATENSQGNSGGIIVDADLVDVSGIGQRSGNQQGSGGNSNTPQERPTKLASDAQGAGRAGDLVINTRQLRLRDGARITASTVDTPGGGNIIVNASESVELIGTFSSEERSSALSVQTRGDGQAGDVIVNTRRLNVRDGAEISASTFGAGDGGNIIINATESVEVIGTSELGTQVSRLIAETGTSFETRKQGTLIGTGDSGNLIITTGRLQVRDGAKISVSGLSLQPEAGDAGELDVNARVIELDNQGAIAATTTSGHGGDIVLQVQDLLLLRRNSRISTTAGIEGTGGDGGNIAINADLIAAIPGENSDITANAFLGRGGRITITSQGIFGIEERPAIEGNRTNDIDASSQFGNSGEITLDVSLDPSPGLTQLPSTLVDPSGQINRTCAASNRQSQFTVTGRGGLPENPTDLFSPDLVQDDFGTVIAREEDKETKEQSNGNNSPISHLPKQIIEAQGWIIDAEGNVVLTAYAPNGTPHGGWQNSVNCQVSGTASR